MRRRNDDLLSESATAEAGEMLEQTLPPGAEADTDTISDADLAALSEGPQAPVGADPGVDAPPVEVDAGSMGGMSPEEQQAMMAMLEEAAKRKLLMSGGAGGAGGGGMAGL